MVVVSIICPIYNEELFVENCIQSIISQDISLSQWELLLVDGGSTDRTRELIEPYLKLYSNIKLLNNPHRTAPCAMNIGIRAAKGEYICRIDAHSSFPTNYVSTLLRHMQKIPDAANVGAVCHTEPRNNSQKAKAIALVLSNRFGVGGSSFRIGVEKVTEVDTVPFGFFKKHIFEEVGLYNESLTRNQDIELNKRIVRMGGKIYLIPETYCTYYARATYSDLASNNYANGKWNILTIHYTHDFNSLSIRHFIPLLFVLSIPMVISVILYLVVMSIISIHITTQYKINFFYVLWAFIVLHISYGTGSLAGLIQLPFLNK